MAVAAKYSYGVLRVGKNRLIESLAPDTKRAVLAHAKTITADVEMSIYEREAVVEQGAEGVPCGRDERMCIRFRELRADAERSLHLDAEPAHRPPRLVHSLGGEGDGDVEGSERQRSDREKDAAERPFVRRDCERSWTESSLHNAHI